MLLIYLATLMEHYLNMRLGKIKHRIKASKSLIGWSQVMIKSKYGMMGVFGCGYGYILTKSIFSKDQSADDMAHYNIIG